MGRMDMATRLPVASAVSVLALLGGQAATATLTQTPGVAHAVGYYDAARQRPVLVGGPGQARAADRDRVWSWTGSRWQPESDSGPPARGNAGAAYDARRKLAVVTGGARRAANDSTFEIIADTWLGESTTWRRLAGSEIPAVDHQALVYDDARGTVLMFGGILADRAVWPSHTWELRTDGWTRIATEGPSGRGRTGLVYDSKRRHVVLFGGVGAPSGEAQTQPFFSDTWVFEHGTWRKAADGGPRGRYAHGMVYDERAGVVLLYSGAAAHRDAPLADMWQWDGQRWTEIRLTGPTPGFRYQPVMIYDRARAKTILYGGLQGSDDATWEWDGRRWTKVEPR